MHLFRSVKQLLRRSWTTAFIRFVLPKRQRRQWERIKAKYEIGKPIRIAFIVSEASKWKVQPVYDKLKHDSRFSVFAIVIPIAAARKTGLADVLRELDALRCFLDNRGVSTVDGLDRATGKPLTPDSFCPDFLWYEQPWSLPPEFDPAAVSRFCLTLYQPYFVPNYEIPIEEFCMLEFHRKLFAMFVSGTVLAEAYKKASSGTASAVTFVPSGHTAFEEIKDACESGKVRNLVIYAPHWSFNHPGNMNKENYSTFLQTGQTILQFAKSHPEIDWVFKPHPRLEWSLEVSGAMGKNEIQAYWDEWREIGTVCTDGNYHNLFAAAKAMVTDCGSFLTEFAATGKPVIHLIPDSILVEPAEFMKPLFDSFYQVRSTDEMNEAFKLVIEENEDPKADARNAAMRTLGFAETAAADNILSWIEAQFGMTADVVMNAHSEKVNLS